MPSRNVLKDDVAESYYHVYARGAGKQAIFLDDQDYNYFTGLFARYLSSKPVEGKLFYIYPNYRDKVSLLAYCLMNNHFHILLYQKEVGGMSASMRSIMTSYVRYFNLKYKKSGPLFESRYKASRISQQSYLEHISRYVHLNPRYWRNYPFSSLGYYLGDAKVDWVETNKILGMFKDATEYLKFIEDYEEHKLMLKEIKHELAG